MDLRENNASSLRRGARLPAALLILTMLSVLALAAGCGGTRLMPTPNLYALSSDNPFAEVPPWFRTNTVDVLYATDLAAESDAATNPQGGSRSLAFGVTTVRIGKEVSWDALVAASRSALRLTDLPMSTAETREIGRMPPTPLETVEQVGRIVDVPEVAATRGEAEGGLKGLVAEHLALTPRKEVYVFVHGTGGNSEEPAYVLAGLWHFMGRGGVPVVYTWPAGAGGGSDPARGYAYDRESGKFTVYHLKQFLRLLATCPGVEKVHILAQSRGTDTILTALRELNSEILASGGDTRQALRLGCLVLAMEVSSQGVAAERLTQVPEQMVLYVSPNDLRLNVTDILFDSKDPPGQLDRSEMTAGQLEALRTLPEIQFIDVRIAGSGPWSRNRLYDDPAVSSDLILLLRDNRRPGIPYGRPLAGEGGTLWRINKEYPAPAEVAQK